MLVSSAEVARLSGDQALIERGDGRAKSMKAH
jgi:hypothetical protein